MIYYLNQWSGIFSDKGLSQDNGQKPHFWHFRSFKNAFLRLLNDPSWPGSVAKWWNTYSSIIICNIKSIQQTKLKIMAKNLIFDTLGRSKVRFWDFWIILRGLVVLPNVRKHIVLSSYTISSQSKRPNSRQWPKNSLLALRIIQKCFFETVEWSFMTW